VSSDRHAYSSDLDLPARGAESDDTVALEVEPLYGAVLDNVYPQLIGRAGIAPCNGVVPNGAAAPLQKCAFHREARVFIDIQQRQHLAHAFGTDNLSVDAVAVQPVGFVLCGFPLVLVMD
jgi:hypothetical protein